MAKIDLDFVLSGSEYEPKVGLEYEIGPGIVGKMRYPTIDLQAKAQEAASEESQIAACKLVLEGLPEDIGDDAIGLMPAIVVADFFSFALRIGAVLKEKYSALDRLGQNFAPAKADPQL